MAVVGLLAQPRPPCAAAPRPLLQGAAVALARCVQETIELPSDEPDRWRAVLGQVERATDIASVSFMPQ
jgi:hypothetical protein